MKKIDIDMVYTYVNGNDPEFIKKKQKYQQVENPNPSFNPKIRTKDINEIFYSVRSVIKFIPWIRRIYIVTDNQIPPIDRSLIASRKVFIVDHKRIIDKQYLPTFNSTVIESFLHRIPGLSEIFLYNNDDCMHLNTIKREDIYEMDGKIPILKIKNNFNYNQYLGTGAEHASRIALTGKYFLKEFPKMKLIYNHHTKIFRKSTLELIEKKEKDLLHKMRVNKFRGNNFMHYTFFAINLDNLIYKNIVSNDFSDVMEVHCGNMNYRSGIFDNVQSKKPKFLCLNSMNITFKKPFADFMNKMISK